MGRCSRTTLGATLGGRAQWNLARVASTLVENDVDAGVVADCCPRDRFVCV
jgi:hypothetical protein